jgi:Carboxypeptidase regulatory-like domain
MYFLKQVFRSTPFAVLCALALALATITDAQSPDTSSLHGTITDQTGSVVVGALVSLESGAAQKWTSETDGQGGYAFEQVPPGRYKLTVRYPGFLDFTAKVELPPQVATSRDVHLKIGISVSAEVRSTDPRKNLSALVLTSKDIAALPDDPRVLLQRLLEMAGSTGRPSDVAVIVDGFREYKRLPPKNTIDMIRINSNPFSAEFSQPGLDRIEITTKAGSDTFHGEIRAQFGDSALNATNPLAPTKPETENRDYNGYLQGPIYKERVDFLAYGGQWRQEDTAVVHATVVDPATGVAGPSSAAVPTPARINSAMLGLNFLVFDQRVNVSYTRNEERRENLGLESGLDLPERAYDRSSIDEIGRLLWTSVGSSSVNDARVELRRAATSTAAQLVAPAVMVLDAFNAGGNLTPRSRASTTTVQVIDAYTMQRGKHTIKAGGQLETFVQDSTDLTGFAGWFVFGADVERDPLGNPIINADGQAIAIPPIENYRRTVLGLPGYTASQFWIVRGTPHVGVKQWNAGWFVLDDWALSNRVSLSYGVRQELQNNIGFGLNLAPRATLSWLIDEGGKNAIKLGAGIFSGRVEPGITFETEKANGVDRQQLLVDRPPFPIPSLEGAIPVKSAVYTKADDLGVPSALIARLSYERQLPGGLFAVAQYTVNKGVNLLRLRNIAAPAPGDQGGGAPVLQFESTGRSLMQQMMLGLRGYVSSKFTLYANYIYGKKESDTDDPYTTPADSHDLSIEYGSAGDDQRHFFVAGTTTEWSDTLWISPSITVGTGRPFNTTTGLDNNRDSLFSDRPAFAADGDSTAIETPFGQLTPNLKSGDSIIPRNLGREPMQVTVNLSATYSMAEGLYFTLDVDNLLNSTRISKSNGVLTSPTFGMPVQALDGRRLLLSVRYGF